MSVDAQQAHCDRMSKGYAKRKKSPSEDDEQSRSKKWINRTEREYNYFKPTIV